MAARAHRPTTQPGVAGGVGLSVAASVPHEFACRPLAVAVVVSPQATIPAVTQLKQQLKRTGAQRDRDLFRPLLKGLSQQAAQLRRAIANKKGSARLPWF